MISWFAGEQTQSSDWLAGLQKDGSRIPGKPGRSLGKRREKKKRPEWEVQVSSGRGSTVTGMRLDSGEMGEGQE